MQRARKCGHQSKMVDYYGVGFEMVLVHIARLRDDETVWALG